MKISKARLRQIINESYKKVMLNEYVFPAISLLLTEAAIIESLLWTIGTAIISQIYMGERSKAKLQGSKMYNSLINNDDIAELLAIAAEYALQTNDQGLLNELKAVERIGKEISTNLGIDSYSSIDATFTAADFTGGLVALNRRLIGTPLSAIFTGAEIANFEVNLSKIKEDKVNKAFNMIEGILTTALDIQSGNINKGSPSRHAKIKIDGTGLSIDTSSRNERLPGEGAPPPGRPDVGPRY